MVNVGLAELVLAQVALGLLGFAIYKLSLIKASSGETPTVVKMKENQNKIVEDINDSFGSMSDRLADLEDAFMALAEKDGDDDEPKAKVGFKTTDKKEIAKKK